MSRKRTAAFVFVSLLALASLKPQRLPEVLGAHFYDAGAWHLSAGRNRDAAVAFRQSTFFRPGHARSYVDLGDALLRMEDYGGAGEAFGRALGLKEESCAFCGLGAVYYRTGRYEEAERAFRRAKELSPNDECAYDWSGRMYYDLERYEEAAAAFEHEVKLLPRAVVPLHFLGNCYGYLKRYEEAAQLYLKIISIRPDYEDAHYQLGVAYDYMKRYRDAVASYRRALELRPKDCRALVGLALTHDALGERRDVLALHERIKSLNPALAAELLQRLDRPAPESGR